MLNATEQKRFEDVCQEHVLAAVGMYALYRAAGSDSDARLAAVSVRDLVNIAPAYRSCWDRLRPIVQTQGFHEFISIVEHEPDYGEVVAERVLSSRESHQQSKKGCLCVLEGKFSGRVYRLKQAVTRFGQKGMPVAAILQQRDGYSIVATGTTKPGPVPQVNGRAVSAKAIPLRHNDCVEIAGIKARFRLN